MTACGFDVTPARALIWADTELFNPADALIGATNKLFINPASHAVATGCGRADVLQAAERAFMEATDFDAALPRIRKALRDREYRLCQHADHSQATFASVGWSRHYGRLIGLTMAGGYFKPEITRCWASPDNGELVSLHPETLEDILPLAQTQMAAIRRDFSTSRGGPLFGAVITRRDIAAGFLMDLTSAAVSVITTQLESAA